MANNSVDSRPNIRTKNIIVTQENTEHILHDLGFRGIFLGITQRAQSKKEQKKKIHSTSSKFQKFAL